MKNNFSKYKDVESKLIFSNGINKKALLTFLIPTCGRYSTLFRTLDSVSNQKKYKKDYNIIVIDNNESLSVDSVFIKKISKYHNISYYLNEVNIGMFGNWNRGIELSNTKYVSMIHDDDTIFEDYMHRIEKVFKKLKGDFWYLKTRSQDAYELQNGYEIKRNSFVYSIYKKIFKGAVIRVDEKYVDYVGDYGLISAPSCGTVLNKDFIINIGGYNEDQYPSSDAAIFQLSESFSKIYETLGNYGLRFYGKNESCKFETMRGFVKEYIQSLLYLKEHSKHGKKIITKFENEMLFLYIKKLTKLPESTGLYVGMDSFNDICQFKTNKLNLIKFKLRKKIRRFLSIFIRSAK